jgi:signal transduction histidine kinase
LEYLVPERAVRLQWSLAKGWAFVVVTATLLAVLLWWELRGRERGIADLRRAAEELSRLSRALRAISDGTQALIRVSDERELLDAVCRVMINTAGHRTAWIGYAEHDEASSVRPVAWAGFEDDHLDTVAISWADIERGQGPMGMAIRTGKPVVCRNVATDPRFAPWGELAIKSGYRSSVALPLADGRQTFGALVIYSGQAGDFDNQELELLNALAAALAFGITTLRTRREHACAEAALRQAHEELEHRVQERTAELAEARDRAEAADRLKSAFLATMSHELRTPLNSVIGFTSLLLQGLAGPLNDEQSKQLGMVKASGQHLLALINDVLDISKIEADQIEIDSALFDLSASIQKVVHTVCPLAAKKQLPLNVQIAPEVGAIRSDQRRVEQVLMNLLNNAIKFTEQGEIKLTAGILSGEVQIAVSDTGLGIRPEDLEKLFQPFRQLDTGLMRRHEGTGLGLAICQRLLDRLGGTIAVESEYGSGSTFRVTLPGEGQETP